MGLFGGYDKNGPGVSKNEPEKKAFFRFFELYFRKFWKLMVANLLYVVVSLPIVTQGVAKVGLTYVTRQFTRERPVFLPSDFTDAIKKSWKQGLAFGILELLLGALCGFGVYYYFMQAWVANSISLGVVIPLAVALFVTVMVTFAFYYVYFQIVTFSMSFKQILKNSFLFAAGCVKQNFLIMFVLLVIDAVVLLCGMYFLWPTLGIVIPGYLLVYPAFRAFLIQFVVFPRIRKSIIDPYYAEHPGEGIEKRRELGIEISEEELAMVAAAKKAEEPIFVDAPRREDSVIPRQYGESEMRRAKRVKRDSGDDDDTI
jgi:uncharacterized membrane protein YesL